MSSLELTNEEFKMKVMEMCNVDEKGRKIKKKQHSTRNQVEQGAAASKTSSVDQARSVPLLTSTKRKMCTGTPYRISSQHTLTKRSLKRDLFNVDYDTNDGDVAFFANGYANNEKTNIYLNRLNKKVNKKKQIINKKQINDTTNNDKVSSYQFQENGKEHSKRLKQPSGFRIKSNKQESARQKWKGPNLDGSTSDEQTCNSREAHNKKLSKKSKTVRVLDSRNSGTVYAKPFEEDVWFPSTSNVSERSNKQRESQKRCLLKKQYADTESNCSKPKDKIKSRRRKEGLKQYTLKRKYRDSESDDSTPEDGISESSTNSDFLKNSIVKHNKKSTKRPATPYYPIKKKARKSTYENQIQYSPLSLYSTCSTKQSSLMAHSSEHSFSDNDIICSNKNGPVVDSFSHSDDLSSDSQSSSDSYDFPFASFDCSNSTVDQVLQGEDAQSSVSVTSTETSVPENFDTEIRDEDENEMSNITNTDTTVTENLDSEIHDEDENEMSNITNTDTSVTENLDSEIHDEDENEMSSDLDAYTSNRSDNILDYAEEEGLVEYFRVKNYLFIVLHKNLKLYIHGFTSASVLHGVVEILGYSLTPSSGEVEIFSPRGSSLLYFESKGEDVSSPDVGDLRNRLSELGMECNEVDQLCQTLTSDSKCAVILCKKISKTEISFVTRHIPLQMFPKCESELPDCVFQNKVGNWNVLKMNSEWDTCLKDIKASSRIFICGGKSVGKSTMLRYMINKLLLQYPEILVLDLDPGQPEFTVPGCVSATVVTEPVFGPNYTHLKKTYRSIFVPDIDVAQEPVAYLQSVKELLLACSNLSNIPVLINYMGFTQGLGLEIFSATVAYTKPTCIIQIQSKTPYKNFKSTLTYKLICDNSKFLAAEIVHLPKFGIKLIESLANETQSGQFLPWQIREMGVLSYFRKLLPEAGLSITDKKVPFYEVDLSEINILNSGRIVNPVEIVGNLVALCSLQSLHKCYRCFGWGIVRAVNTLDGKLYLITPLTPDELEEVHCLIYGSVALPSSVYMTLDDYEGPLAYVAQGVLMELGRISKRSYLSLKTRRKYNK